MRLYKLSGAGNDFLAWVDCEGAGPEPSLAQIIDWCRRQISIGADGFLVLRRETGGVRMVHRDADGSRPELCLNGSRCAVGLAASLGWGDGDRVRLLADLGEIDGLRIDPSRSRLAIPPSFVGRPQAIALAVAGRSYDGHLVRVGGPHLILDWVGLSGEANLDEAPVLELGRQLRHHPDFGPDGANVHFAHWQGDVIHLRSFERGVEGETLACGTGSVAAGLVGEALDDSNRRLEGGQDVHTVGGFRLAVGRDVAGRLTLEGDAREVAMIEPLAGACREEKP